MLFIISTPDKQNQWYAVQICYLLHQRKADMGPSTVLHSLEMLIEKSIPVYKAKNLVIRNDLHKVKKETVEEQKTMKTLKKVHSKKNIISKSSKSDGTDSDLDQLPITRVFSPKQKNQRRKRTKMINRFNEPIRPAHIPVFSISKLLPVIQIMETNIISHQFSFSILNSKDKGK